MEKKWYQSWTVWFNVALLLVGFVSEVGKVVPIPADVLAGVASIGNILLRFKTATALKM